LLIPRSTFTSRLEALLDRVRNARPNRQVDKVRVPGDRARHEMKCNMAEGIELSNHLVKALEAL
jgi:LDH2 family malate/lactate/ureidoglycolate dehydrogenase